MVIYKGLQIDAERRHFRLIELHFERNFVMKIGVMVESFRLGFRAGVEKAAALGAAGIQAYATGGELGYATMTPEKAKEALDIVNPTVWYSPLSAATSDTALTIPLVIPR